MERPSGVSPCLTPPDKANADGIDIDSITNVTVANNTVEAGDDGIAVKTNQAAASNITVIGNRIYGTHGLSIGSQTYRGVTNVLFSNNYVYGTGLDGIVSTDANAINIKTDPTCGGLVQQVTYQNTCITGAKHLIVLNTHYGTCSGTAGTPQLQNIIINGVYSTSSISGAYELIEGYNATYPINAYLAYVSLDATTQNSSSAVCGDRARQFEHHAKWHGNHDIDLLHARRGADLLVLAHSWPLTKV